jgi:hypothetical protein
VAGSVGSGRGGDRRNGAAVAGRDRRRWRGWRQAGPVAAAGCRACLDVAGMVPGYPLRGVATLTAYGMKMQKNTNKTG